MAYGIQRSQLQEHVSLHLLCQHIVTVAQEPLWWVLSPGSQSFLLLVAAQSRASLPGLPCLNSRLWMGCSVLKFGNESESTCETC